MHPLYPYRYPNISSKDFVLNCYLPMLIFQFHTMPFILFNALSDALPRLIRSSFILIEFYRNFSLFSLLLTSLSSTFLEYITSSPSNLSTNSSEDISYLFSNPSTSSLINPSFGSDNASSLRSDSLTIVTSSLPRMFSFPPSLCFYLHLYSSSSSPHPPQPEYIIRIFQPLPHPGSP